MANEFVKVTDQNGVDHPVKDNAAFPRSEQAVLAAKNLLPITLVTQTDSGITITVNNDGTVTLNGTASADIYMPYMSYTKLNLIQGEKYILTGCYKQTGLQLALYPNVPNNPTYRDSGDGTQFTCEYPTADYRCNIIITSGTVLNNVVFKPMLRLASDPDDTYVPYAMTNKELTDAVTLKNGLSSVTVIEGATLSTNDSFLRKQNNVISAQLRVNGVTANSGDNIVTIPSGFIPSLTGGTVVFMSNASTGEMIPAYITINGYVRARTNLSSVDVNINFTYIAP